MSEYIVDEKNRELRNKAALFDLLINIALCKPEIKFLDYVVLSFNKEKYQFQFNYNKEAVDTFDKENSEIAALDLNIPENLERFRKWFSYQNKLREES